MAVLVDGRIRYTKEEQESIDKMSDQEKLFTVRSFLFLLELGGTPDLLATKQMIGFMNEVIKD